MPLRLPHVLAILTLATGGSCLEAQTESHDWFYRAWQTEDGLPENSVSGIVQSPDGFLWVGTNGGASRFNGREFDPLALQNIPDLPSRQVRSMFLDRSGRLWLAMERGPVIRIAEDSFHEFSADDGAIGRVPTSMVDDPEGRLWIGYLRGLSRIEGNTVTRFMIRDGIPSGQHASLACDADGQVWLSNGGRLGRIHDGAFEEVRHFENKDVHIASARESGLWLTVGAEVMRLKKDGRFLHVADLPEKVPVRAILEDRDDALWIGTRNAGLFRLKDGVSERVPTSYPWIDCITEDRDGNIWAGTAGGGLNLIMPRIVELHGKAQGLPFETVQSVDCDASGRLWAVSQSGRVASKESGQWHELDQEEESQWANCVAADPAGGIWIGTREQGLLRIDGDNRKSHGKADGLAGLSVRSLHVARNGDVWIATDSPYQLHRLREGKISQIPHSRSIEAIRAITEAADGSLWFGTSDGHLFQVDGDGPAREHPLAGISSIRALHATPDGSVWIGFAGEGLGHLRDGRFTRIGTSDGLFDDHISQILHDEEGSLWITSNRGLFQVNPSEFLSRPPSERVIVRCRVFGRNDGLPSFRPSRDYAPDSCRGPDGRLTFATVSGLVIVRPDRFHKDSLPPPVVIEKVTVDGKVEALHLARSILTPGSTGGPIDLSKPNPRIVLPPGPDRMVVSFSALSLASPENRGYRYRLTPLDKTWEEAESGLSATFTSLPAGEYQFQVIACNSAGVWNKTGATLEIVVQPFFWETWWFKLGGGTATALAAGAIVFLGLKRRHRAQLREIAAKRALEQERGRIARDIHDDLGASLTRIGLLSQSSPNPDDEATNIVLGQIQSTARHLMRSMDGVVWAIDPEHDSFDDLANYLSTHAQDFLSVAGVSCRLNMPVDLPELPLSAQIRHTLFLAFKEALNNVVKYAGATEVRISLEPGDGFFTLSIQDNGKGIDPDAPSDPGRTNAGSGLANMRNRMATIGGFCTVQSMQGQGTTVEFRVPFHVRPPT
jgi:signal transduction histidine kinase/ligand-binding sensor domain-containing protein